MQTSLVGPTVSVTTGDVYECDDATAQRLIAAGYAVALPTDSHAGAPETAMASPAVERAVRPRGRARG